MAAAEGQTEKTNKLFSFPFVVDVVAVVGGARASERNVFNQNTHQKFTYFSFPFFVPTAAGPGE